MTVGELQPHQLLGLMLVANFSTVLFFIAIMRVWPALERRRERVFFIGAVALGWGVPTWIGLQAL